MAEPSLALLAWIAAGYLAGSIPFGLLLVRAAGLGDIRKVGSGNIGATNVLRSGRKDIAAATFILDALKGALPLLAAAAALGPTAALLVGFAALLGHIFPVWLRFRGGKGVATAFGLMAAAAWPVALCAGVIWAAAAKLSRISSVGAISAAIAAPLLAWLLATPQIALFCAAMAALILLRHRGNIARILAGTEPRIGRSG
jgi:glycerol-3-phosphate acyltransferase PlsY